MWKDLSQPKKGNTYKIKTWFKPGFVEVEDAKSRMAGLKKSIQILPYNHPDKLRESIRKKLPKYGQRGNFERT